MQKNWGKPIMQKKKTSEAQVQQGESSRRGDDHSWRMGTDQRTDDRRPSSFPQTPCGGDETKTSVATRGEARSEAERRNLQAARRLRLGDLPPHTD